jgi:dTDP-4-dehydrorhamnose reductase
LNKVVLLGAKGQLGTDLSLTLRSGGMDLTELTHQDVDVCDHERVAQILSSHSPDVIINTTAFHKLETCEERVDQAFSVNCYAVRNLALVSRALGAKLVHVSTDYVFGGHQTKPYKEQDPLSPLNVYGVSKAAGEYFLRSLCPDHLIIRVSGLFGLAGASGKGGNFVETMLRIGRERGTVTVVTDQVLSPTYCPDVAETLLRLIKDRATGIFHVTNSNHCSWYEFARAIFELENARITVMPTTTSAFGSKVMRPAFSVLENARLKETGHPQLRSWHEALEDYLSTRATRAQRQA